jgi:hypothetical protein
MRASRFARHFATLCLCSFSLSNVALAESIATVEVTDGTVFVAKTNGKRSIVASGSTVEAGDTITTEKDSYARLRFTDGGEIAIRPASSLLVSNYHFHEFQPRRDHLVMRLLKGGIRNLTGLIGKRGDQNAYRLNGATATIGIRGTDFVARICESDCAQEKKAGESGKKSVVPPSANLIAARLFSAEGQAMVTPMGGKPKALNVGDPVYRGDSVESAAPGFATLMLSDETRVVLNAGSRYTLTSYRYNAKTPDNGNMVTDLIKGGMRVVTGLLGKRKPKQVNFDTITATVGVRGTNFDLVCAPTGSKNQPGFDPAASGPVQCDQALYASTRDGEIELKSGQFKLLVPKGQTGYVDAPGAIPVLLDETPGFMRDNPAPKPELLDIDFPRLFGRDGSNMSEPGLYVEVKEGRIALTQQNGEQIEIDAGETGFAGPEGMDLYKMGTTPSFLDRDAYLRDLHVDPVSCRAN